MSKSREEFRSRLKAQVLAAVSGGRLPDTATSREIADHIGIAGHKDPRRQVRWALEQLEKEGRISREVDHYHKVRRIVVLRGGGANG